MFKFISLNTYELELSKTYGRFYRMFPISLLKSYSRREGEKPFRPIDLDKKNRFQVKNIRKERGSKKNPQFLIKWQGYPKHNNIWKSLDYLNDYKDLIKKFRMRNERVKHAKYSLTE
jgi:hypothetical protein